MLLSGIALGSVSGAATAVFLIRKVHSPITTSHLTLVDAQGHSRATLNVNPQNQVALEFSSSSGHRQLLLGIEEHHLSEAERQENAEFWHIEGSVPVIRLYSSSGRKSSELTTALEGNSLLTFYDSNDIWHLGVGYLDDGGDVLNHQRVWGLRASKGFNETGMGLNDNPFPGEQVYIAPIVK